MLNKFKKKKKKLRLRRWLSRVSQKADVAQAKFEFDFPGLNILNILVTHSSILFIYLFFLLERMLSTLIDYPLVSHPYSSRDSRTNGYRRGRDLYRTCLFCYHEKSVLTIAHALQKKNRVREVQDVGTVDIFKHGWNKATSFLLVV